MVVYSHADLQHGIARLFEIGGVPAAQAAIVAAHLVDAESRGVSSHGLIRVAQYAQAIRDGKINLAAQLQLLRENPATAAFDGQHGFGQVMAQQAMDAATSIAAQSGIGLVTLTNCYHTGRLGSYTDHAAQQGYIGLMMVNSGGHGQWVAPFGGTQGRLATDPLSIAVPQNTAPPLVLDFATSIAPEGRIRSLLTAGKLLPDGWVIDHTGQATNDPAALYGPPQGAILPFGGHKGFGLSLIVDILAGVLSGAGGCSDAAPLVGKTDGVLLIAIQVAAFCPLELFTQTVASIVRHVKSSPPQPGVEQVLVPGELETKTRAERLTSGIPIDDGAWQLIVNTAAQLGVAPTEPFGHPLGQ